MKVRVLARAYRELAAGYRFYERKETGLGDYFRETLMAEIDELEWSAGIHLLFFGRYHRKISRRFPYAIYYRVDRDSAVVRAVLDCRIDPKRIRKALN